MIAGVVSADLEATIRLVVLGASGQQQLEAVVDTGFTGFLTLPPAQILSLGLFWLGQEQGILGDGSTTVFDVYQATILWDGQPRLVPVEAADTEPLVGMRLLQNHVLSIEVVAGGMVTIAPLV